MKTNLSNNKNNNNNDYEDWASSDQLHVIHFKSVGENVAVIQVISFQNNFRIVVSTFRKYFYCLNVSLLLKY